MLKRVCCAVPSGVLFGVLGVTIGCDEVWAWFLVGCLHLEILVEWYGLWHDVDLCLQGRGPNQSRLFDRRLLVAMVVGCGISWWVDSTWHLILDLPKKDNMGMDTASSGQYELVNLDDRSIHLLHSNVLSQMLHGILSLILKFGGT